MLDFPQNVKALLLDYITLATTIDAAKRELARVYDCVRRAVATPDVFPSNEFESAVTDRWVQVWKPSWRNNLTVGCPWIHFEFHYDWNRAWVEGSLDIEREVSPQANVERLAVGLAERLRTEKSDWLREGSWQLFPRLAERRMLLVRRESIDRESFSADWIFTQGKDFLNDLGQIVPPVDRVVQELFGRASG